MPTPAKPFSLISSEGKSHRTKAELRQREQAEAATLTGQKIKERPEVRRHQVAHNEFKRVVKLLNIIEKNDAIYEVVINRYCMLQAEVYDYDRLKDKNNELLQKVHDEYTNQNMEFMDYMAHSNELQALNIKIDKMIQTKRNQMFAIEKENIMTVASALRSIPKKAEKKKSPLKEILSG